MQKRVLITDVDNTLLDWQDLWYQTFSAMIAKVIEISGVDPEMLYAQCSVIHQKYGTSEYSRLLGELPCLRELYGSNVLAVMAPAIDAFREARRRALQLYPTVEDTLKILKTSGVPIVAFTESKAFYTNYRFRKLGLDGLVDYLYSPEDHSMPEDTSDTRYYEPESYTFKHTIHRYTPEGELKPNPDILLQIISDLSVSIDEVVYVGDNILKDVLMAQQAGVADVHARYGASQHKPEYELLRKVTHWTPEMVERERNALKLGEVVPTHVLDKNFAQILKLFEAP
ncbi:MULTISPECIES: HAD family hydrolase [unclassified Acidocella]|uniref:HAD family hydrolase n=1 Tax=unclassified Acidocella TaxID=2648610 RepID=UPI000587CF8C|nr:MULTISPECIES: HAD family hydrolase [unclassified Acidocella]WBO61181.1 HAD family hydrolase [Acidocella sp. MX-AZ03]